MVRGKTREFKKAHCNHCDLASNEGDGRSVCTIPNPRIQKGICLDQTKAKKPVVKKKRKTI